MRNELRKLSKNKKENAMNPIDAYLQNMYQEPVVYIETAIRDAWYTDKQWSVYLSTLSHQPVEIPKQKAPQKASQKKSSNANRKRANEDQPAPKDSKQFVKTRMCRQTLANRKCNYRNCSYAHSLDEYFPLECRFQYKCRNNNCNYIHPNETKQAFLDRTTV